MRDYRTDSTKTKELPMDAEVERWFRHLESLMKSLTKRFEDVVSGNTPCDTALKVAHINGKVKTLRLLWIPLSLAVLGGILAVVLASL